jgi:RNA polymerase sigma factor (sigma-70 family)
MQVTGLQARDVDLDEVTQWLHAWANGDSQATDRLFAWIYPMARAIAARRLAGRRDAELSTTQLAHDALLRLLERHGLVDHIRRMRSGRHGGDIEIVTEGQADAVAVELIDHHESLREALDALERRDARKCRVIEMHYFLGFERIEIGRMLDVAVPTVDRDLAFARAWLKVRLADMRD